MGDAGSTRRTPSCLPTTNPSIHSTKRTYWVPKIQTRQHFLSLQDLTHQLDLLWWTWALSAFAVWLFLARRLSQKKLLKERINVCCVVVCVSCVYECVCMSVCISVCVWAWVSMCVCAVCSVVLYVWCCAWVVLCACCVWGVVYVFVCKFIFYINSHKGMVYVVCVVCVWLCGVCVWCLFMCGRFFSLS